MAALKIGTAGVPHSTKARSTQNGIKRVAELGLECMEIEFVRGVQMKEPTAIKVNEIASKVNVELTVHAPYYVNLNAKEANKVKASAKRIMDAANIGSIAGAKSVVFHAAYYLDNRPKEVYEAVKKELIEIRKQLDDQGNLIHLRPETTGSPTQFGTIEEIVKLSTEVPGVYPCIDFSHLHARSIGAYNTYEEIYQVLDFVKKELGVAALEQLHMHLSGIDYGDKGEKKHLILKESDMNYEAVLQALIDFNVGGWLICESPNLEEDALLLKETYEKLQK